MNHLRSIFVYILPLLVWMLVIFMLSTDKASASATNPAVNEILRRIFPGVISYLSLEQIDRIDWGIRKAAHITEYLILALLAFRAVRFGRIAFRSYMVFAPLVFCVLYAASDEYHQSYYAQRGAAAGDVFYDTFGVLVGLILSLWGACLRLERTRKHLE